jgi:hypothetical protein
VDTPGGKPLTGWTENAPHGLMARPGLRGHAHDVPGAAAI